MTRIRVAAVGLGWVAQNRHLPTLDRNPAFEVLGVVDRSPGRAREIAGKRGYARHAEAGRLADVDWLDEVDAVTIATAPMAHYDLAREALARGKHVLTEKPFTMTVVEGEALVASASAQDRRLAIVHNFQFARSTQRLLADLDAGRLGALKAINAVQFGNPRRRLPTWYESLPLGLFYDESPHLLYLTRRVAGALSLQRAITIPSTLGLVTPARIDAYFSAPGFAGPITLNCNFESPVSEWFLLVFGEAGVGIVDVFRDIYVLLPNDGAHATRSVIRTSLISTGQHWLQHLTSGIPHMLGRLSYGNDEVFERFARGVGGDVAALEPIGAESALDVLKLQHAIISDQEGANSR